MSPKDAPAHADRRLVAFQLPEDAGAEFTARGHGYVAVERLRGLIVGLDGDDRAYVVDLALGMLAEFVSCPDGCDGR